MSHEYIFMQFGNMQIMDRQKSWLNFRSGPVYSEHESVFSAATLRLLSFAHRTGATVHVCGCTGTTVNTIPTSLTRTHLLLAGNDTVPISMWRGRGMHCSYCTLVLFTVFLKKTANTMLCYHQFVQNTYATGSWCLYLRTLKT